MYDDHAGRDEHAKLDKGILHRIGVEQVDTATEVMMNEMVSRATRVAILADSTKFGRQLFAQVAELGRADYFVTDVAPPADLADALKRHNVEVLYPES
ncbi:DeoR/GlpR family transcriptional regulator of sugar metabolism [Salinibacterium sp. CAN_S4]|uniref:hypothetical protein n=1 Tax=Salinibacterium sp. CAN_S4 TaxID=2787727 RepID=UPI001A277017